MRGIRLRLIVLVILLTASGMAVTPPVFARGQSPVLIESEINSLRVCIDHLYRITRCQVLIQHPGDDRVIQHTPLYTRVAIPHRPLQLSRKKGRCRSRLQQYPALLRALLPGLDMEMEGFAINVNVSSALDELDQSTIHMGYRECW